MRLNDFHAKGLPPSGGHILSSPAKKEYGKKDAAQGGGGPRPTNPPPWVGVGGAGGFVSATRQICDCIRALYPVSRPLAASLLLTHCGGDLKAFFQGCTLFRFNEKDFRDGG